MSLRSLPNHFDDATHRELDDAVNEAIGEDLTGVEVLSTLDAAILLSTIVHYSNKRLDTKYLGTIEAKKLISANVELRDMLKSAWQRRSYREIRNLAILHPTGVSSSSLRSREPGGLSDTMEVGLMSAMMDPYQGIAVDALYEYLEQNNRNFSENTRPGYYAKFCSVVQSSGTGKTRTILELAHRGVLLLYINLRPVADRTGFPPRDDIPAKILTEGSGSEEDYYIKCCAFFSAIFKLIGDDLSKLTRDGKAAVEDWNNAMSHLESPLRPEFFTRLKSAYSEIEKNIFVTAMPDTTGNTSSRSKRITVIAANEMNACYTSMTEKFTLAFPGVEKNKPKLVIALDEAHTLQELNRFHRAYVLFRVIKTYSAVHHPGSHAVWVVFVSTASKVSHFASLRDLFDSERASIHGEWLFPPYSGTGWDQYAPRLAEVSSLEVAKIKHIIRYGRPLWSSLRAAGSTCGEIFDLAAQKLMGAAVFKGDPYTALAILGQRLGLEICFGHHEAMEFLESAVASHLRVCITTTEDRLWSYTTYPSEPFLSCAAAYLLHANRATLEETFGALEKKVKNGMIDTGKSGELASRLLWLLAKDLFIVRSNSRTTVAQGNESDSELVHCQMIPVVAFFEFLFGKSFWSSESVGSAAKQAFDNAYVNFSHWISMDTFIRQEESREGSNQLSLDEWTLRHWQRTSAVQCSRYQPLIDKVIPVYFKPTDGGKHGKDCVSQILISDKTGVLAQSDALSNIKRADASIGGEGYSAKNLPYIAILADLGLQKTGLNSMFPEGYSPPPGGDAACLRIHARGLSAKTYPFLQDYPIVLRTLERLVRTREIPDTERLTHYLRDQVRQGSSAEVRHMCWEDWNSATPPKTLLG